MANETIKQQPVSFPDLEKAYSDFATGFISYSAKKNQPFFLYYPSHVGLCTGNRQGHSKEFWSPFFYKTVKNVIFGDPLQLWAPRIDTTFHLASRGLSNWLSSFIPAENSTLNQPKPVKLVYVVFFDI